MKNVYKSEQTGRSMVEMLGVLAIIGVLSVGGIAGYSQAMSKFKLTKAMDQVQTILTNIRTLYASQRKYGTIGAESAYKLGILTDETYGDSKGINPFGGTITFGTAQDGRSFYVSYEGLTTEACVKMATADWGADASSGLVSIIVGGTLADKGTAPTGGTSFTWGAADNALPITIDKAVTACGTKASVTWQYR